MEIWDEWLTTVDHKKISHVYYLCGYCMLFRGGMDGLIRAQLTFQKQLI